MNCVTIGREVRVILPGDQELFGRAVALDDSGRLLVQPSNGQDLFAVSAGDIVHLRHSSL
jgi:BirA family biotin operon repressor/biotin-[acetyl-CoA-carboxylase] ligase